jgi:DNA end-binding protein Ku
MAKMLVDSMTAKWDPSQYHDESRDALTKWIEKRIESGDIERPADVEAVELETPRNINLMEALKKSLKGKEKAAPRSAARKKAAAPRRAKKAGRRKAG